MSFERLLPSAHRSLKQMPHGQSPRHPLAAWSKLLVRRLASPAVSISLPLVICVCWSGVATACRSLCRVGHRKRMNQPWRRSATNNLGKLVSTEVLEVRVAQKSQSQLHRRHFGCATRDTSLSSRIRLPAPVYAILRLPCKYFLCSPCRSLGSLANPTTSNLAAIAKY
jgi:hypothetical protein